MVLVMIHLQVAVVGGDKDDPCLFSCLVLVVVVVLEKHQMEGVAGERRVEEVRVLGMVDKVVMEARFLPTMLDKQEMDWDKEVVVVVMMGHSVEEGAAQEAVELMESFTFTLHSPSS
jgi:hypothetical protein